MLRAGLRSNPAPSRAVWDQYLVGSKSGWFTVRLWEPMAIDEGFRNRALASGKGQVRDD